MSSSPVHIPIDRSRRRHGRVLASLLAAIAVLVLAACGATETGVPPFSYEDATEGLIGTEPTALAVFAAEAEADDAVRTLLAADSDSFEVRADARASRGGYLVQPASVGVSRSGAVVSEVGFDLVEGGEHSLWVRVLAPSLDSDATYLGFNGVTQRVFAAELGRYVWIEVGRESLASGRNVISLGHGEPGLRIDLLAVVRREDVNVEDLERLVVGDEPAEPQPVDEPETDPEPTPADPARSELGLRGDPGFVVSSLSGEARASHERLLAGIADGRALSLAGKDDLYEYARTLHTHVQSVLIAFRMTGDLTLLDHIDEVAEVMRAQLRDEWRGTRDGTDGTRDGYLNWVYRYDDGDAYVGKDTHQVNDMKTHAMVAMIAYALEVNRDLVSPSGRAYGAHADFWKDYLVDHFEAKWRERTGVASGFPIMLRPHTHTYYSWMKWHYYMGLLTGESGYRVEAERMASVLEREVRSVSTSAGVAYVWARSVLAEGGGEAYLHPTTYARYVFGDVVEMHLEGFDWWASEEEMARFARTFTEFVVDRSDPVRDGFASDVGGGTSRAGLVSDSSWGRLSAAAYGASSYALIAAWDGSGRLAEVTADVVDAGRAGDGVHMAAATILHAFGGTSPRGAAAAVRATATVR